MLILSPPMITPPVSLRFFLVLSVPNMRVAPDARSLSDERKRLEQSGQWRTHHGPRRETPITAHRVKGCCGKASVE